MPTLPDILPKKPEFISGWFRNDNLGDNAWRRMFLLSKEDSFHDRQYVILLEDRDVVWSMGTPRPQGFTRKISNPWLHRASIVLTETGKVVKNRFNRIGFENE